MYKFKILVTVCRFCIATNALWKTCWFLELPFIILICPWICWFINFCLANVTLWAIATGIWAIWAGVIAFNCWTVNGFAKPGIVKVCVWVGGLVGLVEEIGKEGEEEFRLVVPGLGDTLVGTFVVCWRRRYSWTCAGVNEVPLGTPLTVCWATLGILLFEVRFSAF